MNTTSRFILATLILVLALGLTGTVEASQTQSYSDAKWCGRLSSYTTWYNGKPILFVWKGNGRGNPTAVSVYYDGKTVPNSGNGVQTYSGPQADSQNGWVGYYISTRYRTFIARNWDDDWRWEVRGCLP